MKAVLISIQPQHCVNITSGRKRIEVRKKRPTCKVPFKAFIYCTSIKSLPLKEYVALHALTGGLCDKWSGKVIGEFVCDKIYEIHTYQESDNTIVAYSNEMRDDKLDIENATCLEEEEIVEYLSNAPKCSGYGWHISDLKIYDKPKELSEFRRPDEQISEIRQTEHGVVFSDAYKQGAQITRPPQSYMYVEEIQQ